MYKNYKSNQIERRQNEAYIALNNLYLAVERREVKLTVRIARELRVLSGMAYNPNDSMIEWWQVEFGRLSGWLNV